MPRLLTAIAASFVLATSAQAADMQPILQLDKLVDGEPAQTVTLYATDIDPNSSSVDDSYRLTVNGQEVDLPRDLLARLDHERRGYSYDNFTDGIAQDDAKAVCMMAGPALGSVLSVLYLTYEDHKITASEMRPVLSRADNCLFVTRIRPVSDEARFEAAGAMATLQTLLDLHGG
jgi:hypothetical protein